MRIGSNVRVAIFVLALTACSKHKSAPDCHASLAQRFKDARASASAKLLPNERADADATLTTLETAVEQKWAPSGQAEPTVLERQMARPEKKTNTAMIAAIAAVVVIAIGIGIFVMLKKQEPAAVATNAPSGAQVTATADQSPIAGGKGALLLSAAPWGDIEKIVGSDQKTVPIDDGLSTPARIELAPGTYAVTLAGPTGPKTVNVNIEAGKKTRQQVDMSSVDVDGLTKEIQP